MPEHELLQDFQGAGAVFAGGVDVAADVEAVPAELRHLPPGLLLHGGPRPGHARHRRQAERDGAAEPARSPG